MSLSNLEPRHGGRSSSRDRLLDAAASMVAEHGVHNLTIDAVAAAAGVTKGGLIYHFKTRDDLLGALVERMVGVLDARSRTQATAQADGPSPRALLQVLADATFDMQEDEKRLFANLLAAASAHPLLVTPAQALFTRIYAEFAQAGKHSGLAMLLAAALDGISLLEMLNLHTFTPRQLDAMRRAMRDLARELP